MSIETCHQTAYKGGWVHCGISLPKTAQHARYPEGVFKLRSLGGTSPTCNAPSPKTSSVVKRPRTCQNQTSPSLWQAHTRVHTRIGPAVMEDSVAGRRLPPQSQSTHTRKCHISRPRIWVACILYLELARRPKLFTLWSTHQCHDTSISSHAMKSRHEI
jgi:hypothetical protein